ncbi:MAG: hypothetical protein WAL34_03930 [Acidobacteriaceae bacterium]
MNSLRSFIGKPCGDEGMQQQMRRVICEQMAKHIPLNWEEIDLVEEIVDGVPHIIAVRRDGTPVTVAEILGYPQEITITVEV